MPSMKGFSIVLLALLVELVRSASLQSVSGWGTNPSNIQMSIYVPDRLAARPAIVVGLHGCGGNGQQMFQMSNFASSADQYGFIMIFPGTTKQNNCWDAHSAQSLTRNNGGDSQGIYQQVQYALQRYNGDPNRVYVTGFSSGGFMTNVMAAVYPDVFEAAAPAAGVPAFCWFGAGASNPAHTNTTCANGQINKTPQEWGNYVRNANPGYTGRRPRMQVWHGEADTLVRYNNNYQETLEEWSNVWGVSITGTATNTPQNGYTRTTYGTGQVVGYSAAGVGHAYLINVQVLLNFFGVLTNNPVTTTTTSSTTSTTSIRTSATTPPTTSRSTTTPTVTTTGSGPTQTKWGQCGGIGWNGATSCVAGSTCQSLNPYYSQCL